MASKRSYNALTHGLFAREVALPWEDAKKFEAFKQAIHDELNPRGPLEEEAANEIVDLHWRKQRLAIGYLLQFYKVLPPPELIEAANGGLASLARYLQTETHRRAAGTLRMTGTQALDYVKRKLSARSIVADDAHLQHPTPSVQRGTTAATPCSVLESAYDAAGFDQLLRVEMKIDSRIAKTMARLVCLKEYKLMYCRDSLPALPSPPPVVEGPTVQPMPQPDGAPPQAEEPKTTKVRKWGDPN
jgi:hypothetical protein